jgi:hypothetical protein
MPAVKQSGGQRVTVWKQRESRRMTGSTMEGALPQRKAQFRRLEPGPAEIATSAAITRQVDRP